MRTKRDAMGLELAAIRHALSRPDAEGLVVRNQRETREEMRASSSRLTADRVAVRGHFMRRSVASKRQLQFISERDEAALRFLLEEVCNRRAQALSIIDAIFQERIRGGSFFECLVGHFAFGDRGFRGPRAATKSELRRYADLFAEVSAIRRSA